MTFTTKTGEKTSADLLLSLAERCEKATGPDYPLEQAIGAALGCPDGMLPRCYTRSIDAAMTLVPEGWFWMAGRRDANRCRAHVNNGESHFVGVAARPNPKKQWFECLADTVPLALCAAALRARGDAPSSKGSRDD